MLGALIIVFREVIEAGIIVGIVMAVTKGVRGSRPMAGAGVVAGVVGASLVAAFAGALADALNGVGQELFNASILSLAVCMLAWHNVWMASHGRQLAAEARQLGQDVRSGARSLVALAIVVAVAVMREGSEVALFLYGLVAAGGTTSRDLADRLAARPRRRRRRERGHVFRPGDDSGAPPVRGDERAHHLSRRGPRLAGGELPSAGRRRRRRWSDTAWDTSAIPVRHEPIRPRAAYAWSAIPTSLRCCRSSSTRRRWRRSSRCRRPSRRAPSRAGPKRRRRRQLARGRRRPVRFRARECHNSESLSVETCAPSAKIAWFAAPIPEETMARFVRSLAAALSVACLPPLAIVAAPSAALAQTQPAGAPRRSR